MANKLVVPWRHNLAYLVDSLKANEINGVDTTIVLKNFVASMYLFLFDFWNYIDKKEESHCGLKIIWR